MEDSRFIRCERTARGFDGVILGHGPNVSQDEGGFSNRFAVEFFIARPHDGPGNTTAFNGDVQIVFHVHNTVCFIAGDVELSLAQPRHVGDLTQHSGDFVDGAVIVGFG